MLSTRYVVVVLPFVPVMPTSVIAEAGLPSERATSLPSILLVDGTTICGTFVSTSCSTTTAAAPFSTAVATNAWPPRFRASKQGRLVDRNTPSVVGEPQLHTTRVRRRTGGWFLCDHVSRTLELDLEVQLARLVERAPDAHTSEVGDLDRGRVRLGLGL